MNDPTNTPPSTTTRAATTDALMALVRGELEHIAPDIDAANVSGDVDYRDDVGLDSMDFLTLLTAIEQRTGVSIPEIDYAEIATLNDLVGYLVARSASTSAPPEDG